MSIEGITEAFDAPEAPKTETTGPAPKAAPAPGLTK